jgi:tRNA (guanine-N7-)-methyltransferase
MVSISQHIKSFARRRGRPSVGQVRAFETVWPQVGLTLSAATQPISFAQIFGRTAPIILEIGFGNGQSLLTMAQAEPDKDFVGIEVHYAGMGALLQGIEQQSLNNLRVYLDDAVEVLQQAIPDASLDRVQLFFPDPWPKKRHHKRRLVQSEFVQLLRLKLKVGGIFHMATDWQAYAEHMSLVMEDAQGFANLAGVGCYSSRPDYRPLTKYEQRGHQLGHEVFDLLYERIN